MKYGIICSFFLTLGMVSTSFAQQTNAIQVTVPDSTNATEESKIQVSFEVEMVNSVEFVEVKTTKNKKIQHVRTTLDDYFLPNPDSEDVFVRVNIGTLKELANKEGLLEGELSVFGPAGKLIYKVPLNTNLQKYITKNHKG